MKANNMAVGYLDTNILIGYFAGHAGIMPVLERFEALKVPALAYAEFMVGLKDAPQRQAAIKIIDTLFEIVHTNTTICQKAAELRRETRLKMPDALIYATAHTSGGTLITRDRNFAIGADDIYIPD